MRPFMIMGLVLVEVALWQWRVAVTGRGQFVRGAMLGGVDAVIHITVVIRLVGEVGSTASSAGYAFGVAVGGLVDRRATRQMVEVQVIAPSRLGLQEGLRVRGWPTTRFTAHGHDEELDVVNIAIEERLLPELEEAVDGLAPDAGWIIERMRGRGLVPARRVNGGGRAHAGPPSLPPPAERSAPSRERGVTVRLCTDGSVAP